MNVIFPHPVKITESPGSFALSTKVLDLLGNPSITFQARVDQLAMFEIRLHVTPKNAPIASIGGHVG